MQRFESGNLPLFGNLRQRALAAIQTRGLWRFNSLLLDCAIALWRFPEPHSEIAQGD